MSLFSPLLPFSEFTNWNEHAASHRVELKQVIDLPEVNFRKRIGSRGEKSLRRNASTDDGKLELADCATKRNLDKFNFFEDEQVRINGSIFQHREDFNSLKEALPWDKQNAFSIKMEDDCPQGGDDTRLAVLRALGTYNYRTVQCVLCQGNMIVYDRYPLIDGTFFLSPIAHCKSALNMKYESKNVYLQAICVYCIYRKWICGRCRKQDWFMGSNLIVGTLYTYDVLSISTCCQPFCNYCMCSLLVEESQTNIYERGNYNLFFVQTPCSTCHRFDYHYVRRTNNFKMEDSRNLS